MGGVLATCRPLPLLRKRELSFVKKCSRCTLFRYCAPCGLRIHATVRPTPSRYPPSLHLS